MKRLLFFLLLSLPLAAGAQTPAAADSTLPFPVTVHDARFVAGVLPPGSTAIISIAKALKGRTDSTETVNVIIRQRDVVQVAEIMRTLQEGLSGEINTRIHATALSLCPSRPWMAARLIALHSDNVTQFNNRAAAGAAIIKDLLEAWNRK